LSALLAILVSLRSCSISAKSSIKNFCLWLRVLCRSCLWKLCNVEVIIYLISPSSSCSEKLFQCLSSKIYSTNVRNSETFLLIRVTNDLFCLNRNFSRWFTFEIGFQYFFSSTMLSLGRLRFCRSYKGIGGLSNPQSKSWIFFWEEDLPLNWLYLGRQYTGFCRSGKRFQ